MEFSHDVFLHHLAQTTGSPFLLDIERAEGIYLYSTDGTAYMDMISGVAVSNIGHRHPHVLAALKTQIDRHLHVMVYGEFVQSSSNRLALKLVSLLPSNLNCVYFTNSGTEANEGALKLARRCTGRSELISCRNSYHGSTMGSMSVSGNEKKKQAYRPLLPDVRFIRFNEPEDLSLITEKSAAVIIEPIQGDAGVRIPDITYLRALRQRCSETGTLLIFDEIQTGMGRTGKWFAFEHFGIIPDILTSAKALGGGLPLGAFISSYENMQTLTYDPMLGHITTFGGNPLSCAAGLAAMEVIENEALLSQVEEKGLLIETLLEHHRVREIRRKGMLFAIEFSSEDEVSTIVDYCLQHQLICFWFLSNPTSFRIAPPLTITVDEIKKACQVIRQAFDSLKITS